MATGWNVHDTGGTATFFPAALRIDPGERAEDSATERRFRGRMPAVGRRVR